MEKELERIFNKEYFEKKICMSCYHVNPKNVLHCRKCKKKELRFRRKRRTV